jgi:fatty-acyl-CoA synthase
VRFKQFEVGHVIRDAELAAVVTSDAADQHTDFRQLLYETLPGLREAADPLALALPDAPALRAVGLVTDRPAAGLVDAATLRRLADEVEWQSAAGPGPEDLVLIMYTSGTTAHPKGCMLAHETLVRNGRQVAKRFDLTPEERFWDPLPMFHMGSLLPMTAVFGTGATFVSMTHVDVDAALDQLERERITWAYPTFPPVTLALTHHPEFRRRRPPGIRYFCNVAPPDVQRQLQAEMAPARLVSAYGSTETCGTICYNEPEDDDEQRATTCGRPYPGTEVRIVGIESGEDLPPGEPGEILVRGLALFKGYYGDPELTRRSIDEDGWFHTGDICSLDPDGRISYHGRTKDMLKVGGENVAALEVESFLATHPAVKMVQVVGIPDERLTEVVAAFVELAPGAALTEQEAIDFCSGRIARFKVPRHVRFVTESEWPMSATKVQKFRLRERLIEELGL